MKKITGLFGILALLFCLPGCGGKAGKIDPDAVFAVSQELFPDSIAVEQVLVPKELRVVNGYMVVVSDKTDTVFYVYSLPGFRYLYGSVVSGEGPEDLPRYFRDLVSSDGRKFIVVPGYSGQARVYAPQRSGIQRERDIKCRKKYQLCAVSPGGEKALSMKLSSQDGSRYILSAVSGDSLLTVTDSIALRSKRYTVRMEGMFTISTTVNECYTAASGDAFALFYDGIPRAEFYRWTDEGKIEHITAYGDTLYAWKEEDIIRPNSIGRPKEQILYYVDAQASGDHFYAFYRGATQGQYEETPGVFIRVFDRQGHPVKSMRIKGPYDLFAVDEPNGIIYAVDTTKDFDHVYTFRYDLEK